MIQTLFLGFHQLELMRHDLEDHVVFPVIYVLGNFLIFLVD